MPAYDVAVIGLGAMGSAVLAHCARAGMRAVGFEQFAVGHDRGASSGRSRMIRKAYYEHPSYVPLVLRAYDAWRKLERETNTQLLHISGLLMIGGEQSEVLTGALRSAHEYALPVERLSAADVALHFPMFAIRQEEQAVYEADGGYVVPEDAIAAHMQVAVKCGAGVNEYCVMTVDRALAQAKCVVVCAGPWLEACGLEIPLQIERNVQHWFEPIDSRFAFGRCPAFLVERAELAHPLYGFPDYSFGVKAAFHGSGQITHAGELDRDVRESDIAPVREALQNLLPGAAENYLEGKACMYALTPDRDFVVSTHPKEPRIIVAGGFSGHGFKFAPVIGELVADIIGGSEPAFDVEFLSAQRFRPTSAQEPRPL